MKERKPISSRLIISAIVLLLLAALAVWKAGGMLVRQPREMLPAALTNPQTSRKILPTLPVNLRNRMQTAPEIPHMRMHFFLIIQARLS